jgi:indole-3-glycerol phosphate synthase
MEVNIDSSSKFTACFKKNQTLVAASGIHSRNDIERVMSCGIDAFLIGESLSRSEDRVQFLRGLVSGKKK